MYENQKVIGNRTCYRDGSNDSCRMRIYHR